MAVSDWLGSVENLVAAEAVRLDDSAVPLWHFSPGRLLRATGLKPVLDPRRAGSNISGGMLWHPDSG